jgi:hypothetical protein
MSYELRSVWTTSNRNCFVGDAECRHWVRVRLGCKTQVTAEKPIRTLEAGRGGMNHSANLKGYQRKFDKLEALEAYSTRDLTSWKLIPLEI